MTGEEGLALLREYANYLESQALMATPEGRAYQARFKAAVDAVETRMEYLDDAASNLLAASLNRP